jgi:hypothetical protein
MLPEKTFFAGLPKSQGWIVGAKDDISCCNI